MENNKEKLEELSKMRTRIMCLAFFQISWFLGLILSQISISLGYSYLRIWAFVFVFVGIILLMIFFSIFKLLISKENSKVYLPISSRMLKVSSFLFSNKDQQDIFFPIVADWEDEYFNSLKNKQIWKSRWVNWRYIYRFILTMWMKSPLGDLLEFIRKIAK